MEIFFERETDNEKWIFDINNNSYSVKKAASKEKAIRYLKSLKNCKFCVNCKNCRNCVSCVNCHTCKYCNNCSNCVSCADCEYCDYCYYKADCLNTKLDKPSYVK